jgi:hypothetical protein
MWNDRARRLSSTGTQAAAYGHFRGRRTIVGSVTPQNIEVCLHGGGKLKVGLQQRRWRCISTSSHSVRRRRSSRLASIAATTSLVMGMSLLQSALIPDKNKVLTQ